MHRSPLDESPAAPVVPPALRKAVAKPIIDVMKDGQFVFSYYPEQAWLARSALAKCAQARLQPPGRQLAGAAPAALTR